jgi:hypothetical protein
MYIDHYEMDKTKEDEEIMISPPKYKSIALQTEKE